MQRVYGQLLSMPKLWQETWLEQSLYTGQLTAGNRVEINRIGTCIKWASKVVFRKQNFSTSHALRWDVTYLQLQGRLLQYQMRSLKLCRYNNLRLQLKYSSRLTGTNHYGSLFGQCHCWQKSLFHPNQSALSMQFLAKENLQSYR